MAVCCPRCAALTDAQIQALTAGTIWVGQVGYSVQGRIVPVALANVLSPRERELLTALLLAHPAVATYDALVSEHWRTAAPDIQRAEVRERVGRLNDQLAPYHVKAVNRSGQGYHLVELAR